MYRVTRYDKLYLLEVSIRHMQRYVYLVLRYRQMFISVKTVGLAARS